MNVRPRLSPLTLSIAAVERDTGLSKDTLRVWERRYRFPAPGRDGMGERAYTLEEVEKLRLVKRLLDAGHRPGRIVPLALEQLQRLSERTVDQQRPERRVEAVLDDAQLRAHLALVRAHRPSALREEMRRLLARVGVVRFVVDVVAPLNAAMGEAWMRGQLEVFEEHAYTEVMQGVLRQAIAGLPAPAGAGAPQVLLTTLPGEPHGLGLLMAEALLAAQDCRCISLGVQTPLWDIVLAAGAFRADVVALSFTATLSSNQIVDSLTELRAKLPQGVELWAGGSAPVLQRRLPEGVEMLASIQQLPARAQALQEALAV